MQFVRTKTKIQSNPNKKLRTTEQIRQYKLSILNDNSKFYKCSVTKSWSIGMDVEQTSVTDVDLPS